MACLTFFRYKYVRQRLTYASHCLTHLLMIKTFRSKALRKFAEKGDASKLPVQKIDRVRRILMALDVAARPEDMNIHGLRFHGLQGDPKRYAVDARGRSEERRVGKEGGRTGRFRRAGEQ